MTRISFWRGNAVKPYNFRLRGRDNFFTVQIYFILRLNKFVWTYDREGLIFYRQHSLNIAGENRGVLAKISRLKVMLTGWYGNDFVILHRYAERKGLRPRSFDPLKCRRSCLESIFLWLIYKFFLQKRVNY